MSRANAEIMVGVIILIATALILFIANNSTSQASEVPGSYSLIAKFSNIDGVHVGSDVRINGIKVGSIVAETLNHSTYLAVVRLKIDPTIRLPDDTTAEIQSNWLLGSTSLALVPGSSERFLPPGGAIKFTRSAVTLEDLIGRYIFSPGD